MPYSRNIGVVRNDVSTIEERVNGCMVRSMNGKELPLASREMKAFTTYMHFLSKGVPVGEKVEGQGVPRFTPPNRKADVAAGLDVYNKSCISCHGENGAGRRIGKAGDGKGYLFPALWGKDSFNTGAGMNRLLTASAFIKNNMPLGVTYLQPQLTDDESYDVAAYVLSKVRPIKARLDKDFPARKNKPVDAAFAPYVDGVSADQHKCGPFQQLTENMKKLNADKPVK